MAVPRYEGTTDRTVRARPREIQRPPPPLRRKEAGTSPLQVDARGVPAAAAVAVVAPQELRVHSGSSVGSGLTPDGIRVHRSSAIDASQVKSLGGVRAGSIYRRHIRTAQGIRRTCIPCPRFADC
jgi:hypothetical protein